MSKPEPNKIVQVRLVETYYRNRLEWEDGPGSLRNVVSDSTRQHQELGYMALAEAESLTKGDLEQYYYVYFEEDSDDGFEEYSYMLQYLEPASGKWRLVKVLS